MPGTVPDTLQNGLAFTQLPEWTSYKTDTLSSLWPVATHVTLQSLHPAFLPSLINALPTHAPYNVAVEICLSLCPEFTAPFYASLHLHMLFPLPGTSLPFFLPFKTQLTRHFL